MRRPGRDRLTPLLAVAGFVAAALTATGPGLARAQESAPRAPPTDSVFTIETVAPGVWAAVVRPEPAAYAFANSLVVDLGGELLVVDTQQSPAAARALIGWIREEVGLPVTTVVNTHWHGDHVYGNAAYREAYPDVSFVGHVETARVMARDGAEWIARELEGLPGSIEAREEWLRTGEGPDGDPLMSEEREAVERSLRLRRAYLAELRALELVPPGRTVTEELILTGAERTVRLIPVGEAHTTGDLAVYLPDERVLAAGDLVEAGLPYIAEESSIVEWADALGRLSALEIEHLLPSHGSLLEGDGLLRAQRALFRSVVDGVKTAGRADIAPAELATRMELDVHRDRLARWGEVPRAALRDWVAAAIRRVTAETSAGPP